MEKTCVHSPRQPRQRERGVSVFLNVAGRVCERPCVVAWCSLRSKKAHSPVAATGRRRQRCSPPWRTGGSAHATTATMRGRERERKRGQGRNKPDAPLEQTRQCRHAGSQAHRKRRRSTPAKLSLSKLCNANTRGSQQAAASHHRGRIQRGAGSRLQRVVVDPLQRHIRRQLRVHEPQRCGDPHTRGES